MGWPRPKRNQWFLPDMERFKVCCCECGLVHQFDFRIVKGRVRMRVRRDNRSTAQKRRHMGKHNGN